MASVGLQAAWPERSVKGLLATSLLQRQSGQGSSAAKWGRPKVLHLASSSALTTNRTNFQVLLPSWAMGTPSTMPWAMASKSANTACHAPQSPPRCPSARSISGAGSPSLPQQTEGRTMRCRCNSSFWCKGLRLSGESRGWLSPGRPPPCLPGKGASVPTPAF